MNKHNQIQKKSHAHLKFIQNNIQIIVNLKSINKSQIILKKINHILRFKIELYKLLESIGNEKKLLEKKKTILMHVLHELSG